MLTRSLLVLACLGVVAACGPDTESHVRVGIAVGKSHHAGVELAISEINQAGGVAGRMLQVAGFDYLDEGYLDPEKTIAWANRLTSDPALLAVVGHSDSTATLAAGALYNRRAIPHLVTVATNPLITQGAPWTYRLCLDDAAQGALLASHAYTDWGKRRALVFYVNDDYGRGLAEQFGRSFEQLGGQIVATVFHHNELQAQDRTLIQSVIRRLASANSPDLLVFLNRPGAAKLILQMARKGGLTAPMLGADNLSRQLDFARPLPLWDGSRVARFFHPARQSLNAQNTIARLQRYGDRQVTYETVFAYDAIYLLKQAVETGGFSREGVREYLNSMANSGRTMEGVGGSYSFGSDRNARRPLYIVEINGQTEALVATLEPDGLPAQSASGSGRVLR